MTDQPQPPDLDAIQTRHHLAIDPAACGTCRRLATAGKTPEHPQCAHRATLLPAPDAPCWEALLDIPEDQRAALPARFHTPVWEGNATPNAWLCAVCWGDGWVTGWPCEAAVRGGAEVFTPEHQAERAGRDVPALVAEVRRLTAELQQARGLLDDVLTVCDATESGARRWENPLPVPEWVSIVRAAADGSNYPAAEKTAHDLIECDHQAEAGQLAEQVKQLRAALHGIESDAERAARKGYDLDAEDIRATARHALTPAAVSGA
jgi:hypothetical protein